MSGLQLKSDLHKIVDCIESEQLLQTIYDFLKMQEQSEEGAIWKSLTDEQKNEVYLSYTESQEERNLVDWETVRKKYLYL